MRILKSLLLLFGLTVESVVGGIVPRHGFDHERFDGLQDGSLIWSGVHYGGVAELMCAMRLLSYASSILCVDRKG